MSFPGFPTFWSRRRRALQRALRIGLGCAAALCIAFATFGSRRAVAATETGVLLVGASVGVRCTILVQSLNFNSYVPVNPAPRDVTGQIVLNCSSTNGIKIRLDEGLNPGPGSNNPNPVRRMRNGLGSFLNYNIYRNAARTQVWGGNTPNDLSVPDGPWPMVVPVYGRIPANQYLQSGIYTDTVVVRVQF